MAACPSCGRDNPADARFCNACGAGLEPAEPARESRKVVTVLFTLLGPAGIGKSRLVADFLEDTARDADVLRGRCLHHSFFAETLALAGKSEEALGHARIAVETLEAKGNDMLAARLRERLDAVGVDV